MQGFGPLGLRDTSSKLGLGQPEGDPPPPHPNPLIAEEENLPHEAVEEDQEAEKSGRLPIGRAARAVKKTP